MPYRLDLYNNVENVYDRVVDLWSYMTPFSGWNGSSAGKNMYIAIRHEYLHIEKLKLKGLETDRLETLAKDLFVLANLIAYSYQVFTTSDLPEGQVHAKITNLLDAVEDLQLVMEQK